MEMQKHVSDAAKDAYALQQEQVFTFKLVHLFRSSDGILKLLLDEELIFKDGMTRYVIAPP